MTECPLTAKELECVKWLSEGHTAAEIATFVERGLPAVQTRIIRARTKTGSATAASLVAVSLRKGWIQ